MPTPAQVAATYQRMITRTATSGPVLNGRRCRRFTGAHDGDGYGNVRCGGKVMRAHRVAYLHRHGWLPPAVMHACDVPDCLEDAHHVAGTQAQNLADCIAKGRARRNPHRGEANAAAVLTTAQVRRIRQLYAGGASQRAIGERFGVSQHAISAVVRRATWAHVA